MLIPSFILFDMKLILTFIAASAVLGVGILTPAQAQTKEVSFKKDVSPVLKKYCYNCHAGEKSSHGLKVDTYDNIMKGSKYSKVIKPEKSAESVIIRSVKNQPGGTKMPPGRRSVSESEIKLIADWIDQGAKNN